MGQSHHFLVPDADFKNFRLPSDVEQHVKALRIRSGEEVKFLDGAGRVALARCREVRPYAFDILELAERAALRPHVELCLAPPKGDDLKEAIQQATEIGVGSVRFVRSEHVQYAGAQEAPVAKSQRVSDSACEQCARPWRVDVHAGWHELENLLRDKEYVHIVADEGLALTGEAIGFSSTTPDLARGEPKFRIYVGPEGGWSERERRLFDARVVRLSLGSLVLRVPTAIVASAHFVRTVYWHSRTG